MTNWIRPALMMIGALAFLFSCVEAQRSDINVLLVTVDTFRPDRLSGYGHNRPTSPYLDSLAMDGVLFEQAFSSSSWTTPGLMSALTGLWAPSHGVDVRGKSLRPGTPTFATELGKLGYAAPDILYLSSIPNFQNLGLTDSFEERDKYLPKGDEVLFEALEAYQDSSFFLYYHYRNLHLPYNPAPPYDELYTPEGFETAAFVKDRVAVIRENVTVPLGSVSFADSDSVWMRGLYDGQIRQMDETFFRPLVQKLRELDLYDRTIVIVTADHGEELLDHGFVGHPSTSFRESAYEEQIRVPLIMACPELISPGLRVPGQVRNVDILPTVLDLLGLPIPSTIQGRSLLHVLKGGELQERPVFTETTRGGYQSTPAMMKVRTRAYRVYPWKLIHTLGPGIDRYELYNLEDDPGEMNDLSDELPERTNDMRQILHTWVLTAQPKEAEAEPVTGTVHSGPIAVHFPQDGDTLRYVDADMTVDVRWSGTPDAGYAIEYDVGRGNYELGGHIPVEGLVSTHGPFTEEMWNMLSLYNPYRFRVVANGSNLASDWVSFHIEPTAGAREPGWAERVALMSAVVGSEAELLFGGLGVGVVILIGMAQEIPPSDAVGWLLIIVLVAAGGIPPIVRTVGRERVTAWGWVVVYSGLIYATLSTVPELWGHAFRLTQGRIDYVTWIVAVGCAVWILSRAFRYGLWTVLAVLALGGIYVWLILWLSTSPAERFHLAEYGLLSLLTFRACRIDTGYRSAIFLGILVAGLIGAGDEAIQWMLPNRVFEWKDIWLNVGSSALGMVLVVLLKREEAR